MRALNLRPYIGRPTLAPMTTSFVAAPTALCPVDDFQGVTKTKVSNRRVTPLKEGERARLEMLVDAPNKVSKELHAKRAHLRSLTVGAAMKQLRIKYNPKTFIADIRAELDELHHPPSSAHRVLAKYLAGYDQLGRFRNISECTGDNRLAALGLPAKSCVLDRARNPKPRSRYQTEAVNLINGFSEVPVIIDLGAGKLFQTLVILVQAVAQKKHREMTVHLIDPIYADLECNLIKDFVALLNSTGCEFDVHVHQDALTCLAMLSPQRSSTLVLGADLTDFDFPEAEVMRVFDKLLAEGGLGLRVDKASGPHLMQLSYAATPWPESLSVFEEASKPLDTKLVVRKWPCKRRACVIM